MSIEPNRVQKGVSTGGQFAPSSHSEANVALAAGRRPELDGWPESLPEPIVRFEIGTDDNAITTIVDLPGSNDSIHAWTKNNGSDGYEADAFGVWDGHDEETVEQAREWAMTKQAEIDRRTRQVMEDALAIARRDILYKATGVAGVPTDEELDLMTQAGVTRDAQLATTALAARRILAAHPSADRAEVETSSWENGTFVSGVTVFDAEDNRIAEYDNTDAEEYDAAGKEIAELTGAIEHGPDPFWTELSVANNRKFDAASYETESNSIDLKAASVWNPQA